WIAAFVSSLIFGLVHMEMQTLIVYMVMGLVFAYIYWKTKRIIIPILVHVSINSFAVLIPLVGDVEKLEKMQQELMIFLNLSKRSPNIKMFMVYFIMGVLFTYVAFEHASETIWNPLTIILLLIAARNFCIAFRTFMAARKQKKQNK